MPNSWVDRVATATPPTKLFHMTTPKKLARYQATGRILAPVRGFDTLEGALASKMAINRKLVVVVVIHGPVWPLPDHHNAEGLAWWTLDGSDYSVLVR